MESLPEGCISTILSLTSPRDACRMALMSTTFRSAADSDTVWLNFLPSDYVDIVTRSVRSAHPNIVTMKQLYLHLCDFPILIDDGHKSFALDKLSGKKCFMISSRNLHIAWGGTPAYWEWTSLPESRFEEVAELRNVCWLEVRGKININMLSPATKYGVYMVYKLASSFYGFNQLKVEVAVETIGVEKKIRTPYLEPYSQRRTRKFGSHTDGAHNYPKKRNEDWLEIELGEYFNDGGQDQDLEMSLLEVKNGNWKCGLIIEGIEIRPKHAYHSSATKSIRCHEQSKPHLKSFSLSSPPWR